MYIEHPKEFTHTYTHTHTVLINEFSEVSEYMITTQKSIVFLYTSKKQSKNKVKRIPFTMASRGIKNT